MSYGCPKLCRLRRHHSIDTFLRLCRHCRHCRTGPYGAKCRNRLWDCHYNHRWDNYRCRRHNQDYWYKDCCKKKKCWPQSHTHLAPYRPNGFRRRCLHKNRRCKSQRCRNCYRYSLRFRSGVSMGRRSRRKWARYKFYCGFYCCHRKTSCSIRRKHHLSEWRVEGGNW